MLLIQHWLILVFCAIITVNTNIHIKEKARFASGRFRLSVDAWHRLRLSHRLSLLVSVFMMTTGTLATILIAGAQGSMDVSVTIVAETLINVIAKPEKRVPATGNDSTLLTVEVRNVGSTSPLDTEVVTTASGGTFSGITLNVVPGTYDVTVKGYSHLRRKKSSITIAADTTIDFTDTGTNKLLSGDVNSTDGDNKVNGIDLSLIVAGLNAANARLDLNRDGIVNGIDLTNAVTNLTLTGDS